MPCRQFCDLQRIEYCALSQVIINLPRLHIRVNGGEKLWRLAGEKCSALRVGIHPALLERPAGHRSPPNFPVSTARQFVCVRLRRSIGVLYADPGVAFKMLLPRDVV